MEVTEKKVNDIFVPKRMIYQNKLYKIKKFDKKYIIKGYRVDLIDGKLFNIIIDGVHPNADPITNDFCLPDSLYDKEFDKKTRHVIENMLRTFNVDACYFTPWGEIEFEED
jgi:hypothetical protein